MATPADQHWCGEQEEQGGAWFGNDADSDDDAIAERGTGAVGEGEVVSIRIGGLEEGKAGSRAVSGVW